MKSKTVFFAVMREWALAVVPTLAAIAFAAFALVDLAPYRAALKELGQPIRVSALDEAKKDTEADLESVLACNSARKENLETKALELTPEWRSCLLTALPGVKTTQGALVASLTASVWLTKHPDDDGIRTAALAAIARGRTALLSSKGFSDSFDKVADAHDRSIIMRLLHRQYGAESGFESFARQLDRAEYGVLLPEVKLKQDLWRFDAQALPIANETTKGTL